jgi:hypothetical protein
LGGSLRDGLQHIAWLGNMRQVDLGLEFIRRRGGGARAAAGVGLTLAKILLYTLRFINFD